MATKFTIVYLMLIAFLPTFAISSSSHNKQPSSLKFKKFTLYQFDVINKTSFFVVPGVAGAGFSALTSPMGTIAVLNDNLTRTRDSSSKVVGNAQSVVVTSSLEGSNYIIITRFKLFLDGYRGTISVVGGVNSLKSSNVPVTGGTEDFLLVEGFIKTFIVFTDGVKYILKIVFNLYWPPYAVKGQ